MGDPSNWRLTTSTANEMTHGFQDWWLKVIMEKTEAEKEITLKLFSGAVLTQDAKLLQKCLTKYSVLCYQMSGQL